MRMDRLTSKFQMALADAQSLAAEMRANSAYWTAPSAQTSAKVVWSGSGTPTITPSVLASAPDCAANNCTAAEAAAYSLVHWAQGLSDLPSNTTTTVTRLATVGTSASAYLIKVSWSENRMKGQGATATGSERHSTTVVIKP